MNYDDFKKSTLQNMESQGVSREDIRAWFVEEMERSEEWKILYPRIYQSSGAYGSAKRVAETYYSSIYWLKNTPESMPAAMMAVYIAACVAKENAFPVFFVENQLLSAVLNTSPPTGLLWTEMKLPFESGVFCLPRGAFKYIDGSEVNHLGWTRAHKGDSFSFNPKMQKFEAPFDTFIIYAQPVNEDGTVLFTSMDANERPYIDDDEIKDCWNGAFDIPFASGDEEFLRICRSLIFGLLLAIDARPQLVTRGQRQGKQSKKSKREFWTPNVIGHGFKVERQLSEEKGSHVSPQLHWRRGHFRQQRHGEKFQQVKTIWLEPMLIGIKTEGNEQ